MFAWFFRRLENLLKLELQVVVNPDVGAANLAPLEEHPDLLTAEPSRKPLFFF